jgi:hypothetical protein
LSNINSPVIIQADPEESTLDIRKILGLILRYWYIIIFLPLLGLGLGLGYTRYLVPSYKITGTKINQVVVREILMQPIYSTAMSLMLLMKLKY